jgi:hypothetical protein
MTSITVKKGSSVIYTESITDPMLMEGYYARMYIIDEVTPDTHKINGVIIGNVIFYDIIEIITKMLPAGEYKFITALWDLNGHKYNPSRGILTIEP